MNSRNSNLSAARLVRGAIRTDRAFIAAVALFWIVNRASSYPSQYLFAIDREIWVIQIGTWIVLSAEGLGLGLLASVAVAAARSLLAGREVPAALSRVSARTSDFLRSRAAPFVLGFLSAAAAWYAWGTLRPTARVHDEAAYLLQANLYASGHWKAAAAPIPEFFEQMYVFVSPFFAAKYPPGFAISLVPGIWLGLPALMPALFVGISGGLLFALARRIASPWIALLAWTMAIGPFQLAHPPALMSEHLSTTLWLASWWCLLRWRDDGRLRDLVPLAVLVAWGAITRPLAMLAAAIPIGVAVIRLAARRRHWRALAPASLAGLAVLAILPVWSWRTTGDWRTSPLTLHIRWYTPYDTPGFGPAPPPLRTLPPDLNHVRITLQRARIRHTPRAIPRLIGERLRFIVADGFRGWRIVLVPIVIFGATLIGAEARFAAVTCLLHFSIHLLIPHSPQQANYYFETYPLVFFCAASGVWALVRGRKDAALRGNRDPSSAPAAALFLALVIVGLTAGEMRAMHVFEGRDLAEKTRFRDAVLRIPAPRAVVFVRYSSHHSPDRSLIENEGDLARERTWLVYDRGADNARLRAVAPDRTPYLYDEASRRLIPLAGPLTDDQRRLAGPSATPPATGT